MFKNYLKIAWRNLTKNKQQTIINLLGLTVGTVSCLTILLYVFDQTGYDEHHDNAENIYRVRTFIERDGQEDFVSAATGPPTGPAMKADFPEVIEACRIVFTDEFGIKPIRATDSEDGYYETNVYLADSTIFKVFAYKFVEGTAKSALSAPNTVALSSVLAKKLFGNEKALNKTVEWGSGEDAQTLTVTGVFDETFGKTHLNPNYIVTMNTPGMGEFIRTMDNFRTNNFVYTYVSLAPGTNAEHLQSKLPDFLKSHGGELVADKSIFLQKVTDIHLYSKGIKFQIDKVSSIEYLYFLLTLAFFIQLVACINFINLSTARANKRAMEIGVRKVVGAGKNALVRQFFGESLLLSFLAVLISIPSTLMLLGFVNKITQSDLGYIDLLNAKILLILVGLGFITGLVAGIYPALILSSIKPVKVLKGTINLQSGNGTFRRVLVVFQFVVSIGLVAAVIIITQQFSYTQNKDLGFVKDNLLAVRMGSSTVNDNYDALKSQFMALSGVSHVAGLKYSPAERVLNDFNLYLPGKNPEKGINIQNNGVSEDYFKAMKIKLLQGREFREGDEMQVIVNQTLLQDLNIDSERALGSKLLNTQGDETMEFEIVGVANDFHFADLKNPIEPLLLYKSSRLNWMVLRMETANYKDLLGQLEQIWKATIKNVPFTYAFMDQEVDKMYEEEKRLGNISALFTIIAILISYLGLFGLVSYVAEQKKKEIGIRKVLGASINSVVRLLTKDFLKLVGIAFLIAAPIAYYLMQRWLEGYTYRIEIHWWVFVLAGGFALVITLFTVGFQSIKSALANPVKSLRTE
ncbi:ABC transporter permease [Ulvibacterium marinum]|uniref:ABC transporter permease n=1 Tax=Ulvibacterium marinum TaxID=2419782 RepID=A0A3B0BX27_9FLAO|nr:ABC transporter permease [Ulvibacterium marinum]RKN77983.1 ABC transporter permease [Ulvibacterium marinum]